MKLGNPFKIANSYTDPKEHKPEYGYVLKHFPIFNVEYLHINTHVNTYICTYIHTNIYTSTHIYIHTYIHDVFFTYMFNFLLQSNTYAKRLI